MPRKYTRTHETNLHPIHDRRRRRLKIVRTTLLLLTLAALALGSVLQSRTTRTAAAASVAARRPAPTSAPLAAGGCATMFTKAAGSPVAAGDFPHAVAVGDFNNDGRQDVATANLNSDNVTILLGNGTGGFTQPPGSPVAAGHMPDAIAVGDFNNDGKPDLAVADQNVGFPAGTVTILLGNGAGGFAQPAGSPVAVGRSPYSVAVADFNNDGRQDLATANQGTDDLSVLLGDGAGGFTMSPGSPLPVSGGDSPFSVAVGDFNNDGRADLVTQTMTADTVTVFLGNGSGGFTKTASSPITVGHGPIAVAVSDFNNDGKDDVAALNYGADSVTILLGDGSGGFTEPASSPAPVGHLPVQFAVGDFNHDRRQDLVTTNSSSDNVTILLGNGAGGFTEQAGSPISVVDGPDAVAVGDFNNDGRPDLATAGGLSDGVTILLNTCAPDCASTQFAQFTLVQGKVGTDPFSAAVADFNLDGKPDVATANANSGDVSILLGDGAGGFNEAPGSPIDVGNTSFSIAAGDFNNDGKADLAVPNLTSDTVTILLGDGAGGFAEAADSPVAAGHFPRNVVVADFNNDGKADLAVSTGSTDSVMILLGDGTGGFTQPAGSPVGVGEEPNSVATGDFNNDGKVDLVTGNYTSNNVTVLLGDGAGGFSEPVGSPLAYGEGPFSVAVADFDNDGRADLAVANRNSFYVTILLGDGAGGFTEAAGSPLAVREGPYWVTVGDFNNDGKPDLVAVTTVGARIFLGDGAGGFSQLPGSPFRVATGNPTRFPIWATVADLNNDGRQDLVLGGSGFDYLPVLLNGCSIDLSITKLDTPDPVLAGDQLTYTLTVTNNSAITAPSVVVTDKLAASITLVSATPSQGSCSGTSNVVCLLGSLPGGASATVKIVAQTNAPAFATNTARVGGGVDPDLSNNAAQVTTKILGLQSLSLSPTLLTGGCWDARYTGTVTLTGPAPARGLLVKLTDDAAEVSSPPSVRIEPGQTTATFTGGATTVTSVREVTFTATLGTMSLKKKLTVQPVRVTSLSLAPNPVRGGTPVTGTLSLTCAPSQDVTVTLTSNKSAASFPARQITVPAGHATGKFTVNTLKVSAPVDALITASANGAAKSATLHIVP